MFKSKNFTNLLNYERKMQVEERAHAYLELGGSCSLLTHKTVHYNHPQNIRIRSYIHTHGRTSMDFIFAVIVNGFEVLCLAIWSLLSAHHCSKSFYRDPLHCFSYFFFICIYQFAATIAMAGTVIIESSIFTNIST